MKTNTEQDNNNNELFSVELCFIINEHWNDLSWIRTLLECCNINAVIFLFITMNLLWNKALFKEIWLDYFLIAIVRFL